MAKYAIIAGMFMPKVKAQEEVSPKGGILLFAVPLLASAALMGLLLLSVCAWRLCRYRRNINFRIQVDQLPAPSPLLMRRSDSDISVTTLSQIVDTNYHDSGSPDEPPRDVGLPKEIQSKLRLNVLGSEDKLTKL